MRKYEKRIYRGDERRKMNMVGKAKEKNKQRKMNEEKNEK